MDKLILLMLSFAGVSAIRMQSVKGQVSSQAILARLDSAKVRARIVVSQAKVKLGPRSGLA